MPPKGQGIRQLEAAAAAAAASGGSSATGTGVTSSTETAQALKFTNFQVMGFLNGKNVASNFVKNDPQLWWHPNRRSSDLDWDKEREVKRRKLMGSEEVLIAEEERMAGEEMIDTSTSKIIIDGEDGEADEAVEVKPKKVLINVLTGAPEGQVYRPTEPTAEELELSLDPMSRTIIIHPGSSWLRIGRASDAFPLSVPNVIARRSRNYDPVRDKLNKAIPSSISQPVFVPPPQTLPLPLPTSPKSAQSDVNKNRDDLGLFTDDDDDTPVVDSSIPVDPLTAKINSIRADLKTRMKIFKLRGQTSANEQAIAYNAEVVPEKTADYNDPNEIEWTDVSGKDAKEFYVGMKALRIPAPEDSGYTLRRPYDRGSFNTAGYKSTQEFLADIEQIWTVTLEEELGIKRSELKDYSAILLLPDLYDHIYVREMTDLVLKGMGFKQICLQQESICATFGAGISTACVIDIGAKTTSITCVEEGLVLPETRMRLDFGGDDITEFLYTLLVRTGFPYREANLANWADFTLMDELKARMVVLSEADVGLNIYDFYVRSPGVPTRKFLMRAYDDVILAPYALFAPRIVDFQKKIIPQVTLWSLDVDDIVDIGGNATTNAMRNSTRHLLPPAPVVDIPTVTVPAITGDEDNSRAVTPIPQSTTPVVTAIPVVPAAAVVTTPGQPTITIDVKLEASKIPLHVAVVESILAAGAEERMKRISQNVLIVGGTALIHNIGFAIESRVSPMLTQRAPFLANQLSIVPPPREIDPKILAWKGISTLCKLECSQDLWIRREDWDALGLRAVKERAFYFA